MVPKGKVALREECDIELRVPIRLERSSDIGDEGAVNGEGNLRLASTLHVLQNADDLDSGS